jgi:hypothetical protein
MCGLVVASPARGAELEPETVAAYERYVAGVAARFATQVTARAAVPHTLAPLLAELRTGRIVVRPGGEDGILAIDDGLIHHWRGAAFIPGAALAAVLRVAQDYAAYPSMYDWITAAAVLGQERSSPAGERFRVFFRIERSAATVSSIVDAWGHVDYRYPGADRATAVSNTDCIRQVEDAGTGAERRLPVGAGAGYLWRADTFSTYLQRDGGVYVEFETIGLSRGYPPLLGWLIEPVARRLGRSSVSESLDSLRKVVLGPSPPAQHDARRAAPVPDFWCTAPGE